MTTPRPTPPEGRASWLDYVLDPCELPWPDEITHARAELAELREALADAEHERDKSEERVQFAIKDRQDAEEMAAGFLRERDEARVKLAIATANAAELAQQRDEALAQVRYVADFHDEVCEPTAKERDALRIQVGDLRRAILGLGILHYCGELLECTEEHVCATDVKRFNAWVSRLRAEAPGKETKQ